MTGDGRPKKPLPPRSLTRIRTLHERSLGEGGVSRHEIWSLVEVGGERKVLFEAHCPKKLALRSPYNND